MTEKEKVLIKQFQPVSIQDDMMFGTVMADPEYCRPFLEIILGTKIERIEYPERQKIIDLAVSAKSIRMDVYIEDGEQKFLTGFKMIKYLIGKDYFLHKPG